MTRSVSTAATSNKKKTSRHVRRPEGVLHMSSSCVTAGMCNWQDRSLHTMGLFWQGASEQQATLQRR